MPDEHEQIMRFEFRNVCFNYINSTLFTKQLKPISAVESKNFYKGFSLYYFFNRCILSKENSCGSWKHRPYHNTSNLLRSMYLSSVNSELLCFSKIPIQTVLQRSLSRYISDCISWCIKRHSYIYLSYRSSQYHNASSNSSSRLETLLIFSLQCLYCCLFVSNRILEGIPSCSLRMEKVSPAFLAEKKEPLDNLRKT